MRKLDHRKKHTVKMYSVLFGRQSFTFCIFAVIICVIIAINDEMRARKRILCTLSLVIYLYVVNIDIKEQALNSITISSEGVIHKKDVYKWKDIYATVDIAPPDFMRNGFIYRMHFGDNYLYTEQDRKSCRSKGLFVDLTEKRLKEILPYCIKEIQIVELRIKTQKAIKFFQNPRQ